jgi:hypothetical protein
MPHDLTLNEKQRAALVWRLGAIDATDVPTQRRLGRLYDALALDYIAGEVLAQLQQPAARWDEKQRPFSITSAMRDDLIMWIEPTERRPLNGFFGRILMPIFDLLKEGRDGKPVAAEAAPE